jgi:tetratricopeptide (TPR) repeat protein
MRRPKFTGSILILLIVFLLGVPAIYNLPPVQERLGWRVAELFARFKYALSPPEQIVFVPEEESLLSTQTASPQATPPAPLSVTTTQAPTTKKPVSSPTSPALTPIPKNIQLDGVRHEYQTWNNCGPATLAMALSYWGWEGDQRPIAAFTKPNPRDKNVMPYELAAYVEEETQLKIAFRVGGDIELLKRFLAVGLPVIIEKGFEGPNIEGWMGHYVLVTGYSDSDQRLTLQDSYYGPSQAMGYADLESYWRAFNFTYLVVYPPERQVDLTAILGPQSEDEYNFRYAAQKAEDEIYALTDRDQFFAWFNRGTNLASLQDYAGAAAAYDQAFALYPTIPEKERPWRIMWYQTGPYWAYYYTGRYGDVINLATTTLDAMSEPVLEESYYWRALARDAVGDAEGAIKDLRSALKYHPGFEPALTRLQQLGVTQ